MRRRDVAIDVGVAGLVFWLTLAILADGGLGAATPDDRRLDLLGVLLAAAATLPLVARRRWPLAVYLATATASLVLLAFGYTLDLAIGTAVAAYSVAVAHGGDRRPVRRWVALLAVAAFVPSMTVLYAVLGVRLAGIGTEMVTTGAIFVSLWLVGDRIRLRQERIGALEEQARRAEREMLRERTLAAVQERARIARDLHDSAGHAINVILVQAGAARLLHQRDPERSRQAIGTVEEVARGLIGEIDRLVRALRDDGTAELGVPAGPAALDELLARHEESGLRIVATERGVRRALPPSVAWSAYRILQEALTNAARHGRGSAEVGMLFGDEAMEITVANPVARDGGGGAPVAGGHGIVGMRERATLLGGSLDTADGGGTFRLHARLPYHSLMRADDPVEWPADVAATGRPPPAGSERAP
ncbi:sensor histidine kinase [Plantactinospora solaniradicis]|uniref:histidine kinase n=1 Tax=Plantactinospora solaniradicis TaxID=1723736 RepID=A0ABW1K137_9ACTN